MADIDKLNIDSIIQRLLEGEGGGGRAEMRRAAGGCGGVGRPVGFAAPRGVSPRVDPRVPGRCGWEAGRDPLVGPTCRPSRLRSFIGLGCSLPSGREILKFSPPPRFRSVPPDSPHTGPFFGGEKVGDPSRNCRRVPYFLVSRPLGKQFDEVAFHRVGGLLSCLPHFYTFCGVGIGRLSGQRWDISNGAAETHLLRSQILFLSCFVLTTSPRSFLNLHLKLKPAMMTVTIFPMYLALC